MDNQAKIKQIEKILGQKQDGVWDDKDDAAFQKLTNPPKKMSPKGGPAEGVMPSQVDQEALAAAPQQSYQ